jgi:hypothetical protein
MDQLINALNKRIDTLRKGIQKASREKEQFPEGHLRCSIRHGHDRYYHVTDTSSRNGIYIKKKDQILAQKLAQKEYHDEFLKRAHAELDDLKQVVNHLEQDSVDRYYQRMTPGRRKLIIPYIQSDESFVLEWQTKVFPPNTYLEENKQFETRRGELVRSKSEMILADLFFELSIPYRYEQPLRLKDGTTRYPDFTLLKVSAREEIYLEHFGMMDNPEYVKHNLEKLDQYRANGIYLGKNLLLTYETEDSPLDISGIRRMIKAIFQ